MNKVINVVCMEKNKKKTKALDLSRKKTATVYKQNMKFKFQYRQAQVITSNLFLCMQTLALLSFYLR